MKVLSDVVLLVFTSKHLSSVSIPLVAKTRSDTSGEMDQTASPACAGSDIISQSNWINGSCVWWLLAAGLVGLES